MRGEPPILTYRRREGQRLPRPAGGATGFGAGRTNRPLRAGIRDHRAPLAAITACTEARFGGPKSPRAGVSP
jgi:hypothetical protein